MRFRKERVALVADAEAMFHQVYVKPSYVDALRYLWWRNGEKDQEPVVYKMLVNFFGTKSSPTNVNFTLKQTAAEFGHLLEPNIWEIVNKHFYVDDCLVSLPSVAEAVTAQTQLCDLSTIASLYDPLGFVYPIVLEPKLLF